MEKDIGEGVKNVLSIGETSLMDAPKVKLSVYHNRKLEISTAPTGSYPKRVSSRVRHTVRELRWMVFEVKTGREKRMNHDRIC